METAFVRLISVALAFGFSTVIALLVRRCFAGWASNSAMGKGACLSFLNIIVAVLLSIAASVWVRLNLAEPWRIWGEAFIVAALCEETGRYLVLFALFKGRITDDPREFIAGAAAIGLGFGVIENLLYLAGSHSYLEIGALRGVLSAPAHLSFSLLSAYGLWSAMRRGQSFLFALFFFLTAVALHGYFDVGLMAWPDPGKGVPLFFSWRLGVIGLAIISAIILTTIATLFVLSEFLDWTEEESAHDPHADSTLGYYWTPFAESLKRVAAFFVISPVLLGVAVKASTGFIYGPLLLGAAASLALWSLAIRQLAR